LHGAALLDSTQIAGLNCLKLVNEITATAIAYGIYKTDLPESDPMHVMFVDIGDSHMSVGVVAFQKGKLRVRPRPPPSSLCCDADMAAAILPTHPPTHPRY
jgi:molecular chaperone DnaK (HSP70)